MSRINAYIRLNRQQKLISKQVLPRAVGSSSTSADCTSDSHPVCCTGGVQSASDHSSFTRYARHTVRTLNYAT